MPLNEGALNELFAVSRSSQAAEQLAHAFEASGEVHLAQMQAYAQQGDTTRFLAQAHAFKGSAATLGVHCVVACCRRLEKDHEHLDCASMTLHVQQLRNSFQQGNAALNEYLRKICAGKR
jgi:two-component system sensor histidine kinase RpfC